MMAAMNIATIPRARIGNPIPYEMSSQGENFSSSFILGAETS